MAQPDLSELISSKAVWMRELRAYITPFIFLIVLVAKFVLQLPIPIFPLLMVMMVVLSYNVLFMFIESSNKELAERAGGTFAAIRVALDYVCLAFLIHYTGGTSSPFAYFYMFSMLGFSIMTGNRVLAVLLSVWGTITYATVLFLEKYGIISHYPPFLFEVSYLNIQIILIDVLALLGVMTIFVFTITHLVKLLEKKEMDVLSKDTEVKRIKEFFDATFNAADDLIWVMDKEGRLLDVNKKVLDLTGVVEKEALGKRVWDVFISKEIADTMILDAARRVHGEYIPPYEFVLTSRDGISIPFEVRASVIPGTGQVLIARDVTKHKALEKELAEEVRRLGRELEEVNRVNEMIIGKEHPKKPSKS